MPFTEGLIYGILLEELMRPAGGALRNNKGDDPYRIAKD